MNVYRIEFDGGYGDAVFGDPEIGYAYEYVGNVVSYVIAPSRGKARQFLVDEFELGDFVYPMSIKLMEKDVSIGNLGIGHLPYGIWYDNVDGKHVRITEDEE